MTAAGGMVCCMRMPLRTQSVGAELTVAMHHFNARPTEEFNIFALGSFHGDDRVGWEVAEALRNVLAQGGLIENLTSPWDLLHRLVSDRPAVIVDASQSGRVAGEVFCVAPSELNCLLGCSSHSVPLCDILALAEQQRCLPAHLAVIGIEVQQTQPGEDLSPAVRAAIPVACDLIASLVGNWTGADDA